MVYVMLGVYLYSYEICVIRIWSCIFIKQFAFNDIEESKSGSRKSLLYVEIIISLTSPTVIVTDCVQ
jgi:hypothetical protein